ncbi:MAG: hypothetical protein L0H63_03715 [Nitrococcus sp.]|nr:hypothetical protein [Nitrococcus sp.]
MAPINQQGRYFLDDQALRDDREETLRRALAQRLDGRDPQTSRPIMRADGRIERLHVVTVLGTAAGLQHVAIVRIPPGQ